MSAALEFRLRPDAHEVRALRAELRTSMEQGGVAEEVIDTLVLVVDELFNNSIEHGADYREEGDTLLLRVLPGEQSIDVEFEDPSVPEHVVGEIITLLEQVKDSVPPPFFERGRGLFLIQDGLQSLQLESLDGGVGMMISGCIAR